MKPTIITVSGKARHGKDSFAKILQQQLNMLGKKSLIINYADYLKFICQKYYGWNGEKDEVGRTILQKTGTEKIRSQIPNFWVDAVINFIKAIEDDFDFIIIPDCRFPNEITRWIDEEYNIFPVHVTRTNFENNLTEEQRNHLSEIALDNFKFDYYAKAKNLDELKIEVTTLVCILEREGFI